MFAGVFGGFWGPDDGWVGSSWVALGARGVAGGRVGTGGCVGPGSWWRGLGWDGRLRWPWELVAGAGLGREAG